MHHKILLRALPNHIPTWMERHEPSSTSSANTRTHNYSAIACHNLSDGLPRVYIEILQLKSGIIARNSASNPNLTHCMLDYTQSDPINSDIAWSTTNLTSSWGRRANNMQQFLLSMRFAAFWEWSFCKMTSASALNILTDDIPLVIHKGGHPMAPWT